MRRPARRSARRRSARSRVCGVDVRRGRPSLRWRRLAPRASATRVAAARPPSRDSKAPCAVRALAASSRPRPRRTRASSPSAPTPIADSRRGRRSARGSRCGDAARGAGRQQPSGARSPRLRRSRANGVVAARLCGVDVRLGGVGASRRGDGGAAGGDASVARAARSRAPRATASRVLCRACTRPAWPPYVVRATDRTTRRPARDTPRAATMLGRGPVNGRNARAPPRLRNSRRLAPRRKCVAGARRRAAMRAAPDKQTRACRGKSCRELRGPRRRAPRPRRRSKVDVRASCQRRGRGSQGVRRSSPVTRAASAAMTSSRPPPTLSASWRPLSRSSHILGWADPATRCILLAALNDEAPPLTTSKGTA